MDNWREEPRSGLGCVQAVSRLLQRRRAAHPTFGLMEAADYNWWWRVKRPTDDLGQLFWFDDLGQPAAALIATQWGAGQSRSIGLDPILLPGASAESVTRVVDRGLAHVEAAGLGPLEVLADVADETLVAALGRHGFVPQTGVGLQPDIEAWLDAAARPPVSALADGYRIVARADSADRPHHLAHHGPDVEMRLRQTPLYRADHDLVVLNRAGEVAAYGLFWFDATTNTGLVEPMRTVDEHQRRGLARHILTAGLERLAHAGAERIKIVFGQSNAAAQGLYLSVGFQPIRETVALTRKKQRGSAE